MNPIETTMGGPDGAFPTTAWSMILGCTDEMATQRQEALERLTRQYWRPVYRFLRFRGLPVETAKDRTQEFLCHLLEDNLITRYEPSRGSFRAFLKGAVKIYLARVREKASAQKRGGNRFHFSLDCSALEESSPQHPSDEMTAEEAFDRQWVADVFSRALDRLQDELAEQGDTIRFPVYEQYELHEGDAVTYQEVAETHNLNIDQVKYHLQKARERFRQLVIETLSDGVASQEELKLELSKLFWD